MSRITRAAKLRACTVRLPGGCASPETTVFAHAPSWASGTGHKSPDYWGAFACARCHDILDGRTPSGLKRTEKEAAWFRAVFETQHILFTEGFLKIT